MKSRLTRIARMLRKRSTDAERLLWQHLRARQLDGLKFRRQQPIGKAVVDFVCFERKVIVELDGGQHALQEKEDKEREARLLASGFMVLRFWNTEVLRNVDGVLEEIRERCLASDLQNTLTPAPRRGRSACPTSQDSASEAGFPKGVLRTESGTRRALWRERVMHDDGSDGFTLP
jgi:very-short-patch-repair endonuclease